MKESKYIELLRHYLFEKIDESSEEYSAAQTGYVIEIISTIFSALISAVVAEAIVPTTTQANSRLLPISIVLAATYFGLRKICEWAAKKWRSVKKETTYETRKLSSREQRMLIARFDNVACDGLILAYDFIQMHKEKVVGMEDKNLRDYYLFEAFFYYKKSIDVVLNLLNYKEECVGRTGGVAEYRVVNVYRTLVDIKNELQKCLSDEIMQDRHDLSNEVGVYKKRLEHIGKLLSVECIEE